MNEALIAVASGDFRFAVDGVVAAARSSWPAATFAPALGPMAAVSEGQLQVPLADVDDSELLAAFLPGGKGISLDGTVQAMAMFIAWVTSLPDFPDDHTVVVLGWAPDELALGPNADASELAAQFIG